MTRRMSRRPSRPLITTATAILVATSLGGCGVADYQDTEAQNCVRLVDGAANPADPKDDGVVVEVVDSQFCGEDGKSDQSHGGGYFFISRGGGYYAPGSPGAAMPVGSRYVHSSSDGGSKLVSSTDSAARTAAGVSKGGFTSGSTGRTVTVKGGGIGGIGGGKAGAGG